MKINEVITKKERVDEVLPALVPLAVTAARTALPHVARAAWKHLPIKNILERSINGFRNS